MRISLKIAISLLVTTIIFALFTSFAYSGLFLYIESKFYNPRLREEYKKQLVFLKEIVIRYHRLNIERYSIVLNKEHIYRSFLTRQLQEDIVKREEDFRNLKANYPFFAFCRLVGEDGKRIHFSTLESDIKEKKAQSLVYYNLNQVEKDYTKELLTAQGENPKIFIHAGNRQFIYSFPVIDNYGIYKGSAIIYIYIKDLNNYLLNVPSFTFQDISLIGDAGLLFNFPEAHSSLIEKQILDIWRLKDENIVVAELPETINDESFLLFSLYDRHFGFISLIIPSKKFQMNFFSQMILLISFFLTVFLTVFLMLNLKQDVSTVLVHRIKRFQIEFIKEFVESKEAINWDKWCQDLNLHSLSIKNKIKSGLGKIKKEQELEIDNLINKSWEEIVAVFTAHTMEKPVDNVNLNHIENLLQQLIQKNSKFIICKEQGSKLDKEVENRASDSAPINLTADNTLASVTDVEELTELDNLEVQDIGAAVDKEALTVASNVQVQEAEVQELEELEELEEQEGGASAGEVAVQKAEEKVEDKQGEEPEEPEMLEELEELTDPEELEVLDVQEEAGKEARELAEGEEIRFDISAAEPEAAVLVKAGKTQEQKTNEGVIENLIFKSTAGADSAEELEELETVPSLTPLPPEPYENLEYLPLVDETGRSWDVPQNGPDNEISVLQDESLGEEGIQTVGEKTDKSIIIHELQEIETFIEDLNTFIVAEDGVFKIRDELYEQQAGRSKNKYFKIDESFRTPTEEVFSQKMKNVILPVSFSGQQGLVLDSFFKLQQIQQRDISQQKAMVTLSKRLNAVAMALLFFEKAASPLREDQHESVQDRLISYLSLGFDEDSVLQFDLNEPFVRKYLTNKQCVIIDTPLSTWPELKVKFTPVELKMIKKAVFLPAYLEGNALYVFFGFCIDEKLSIKEILTNLKSMNI